MARPLKSGLDYFPLDVHFDDPVELIEAEFGLEGFAILIKLWQKIYSNGYYIKWDSDAVLLFSRKISSDINLVNSIVNSCFLRNLFNKDIYDMYGILTSTGIQKRYLNACTASKRKNIVMEECLYLLGEKQKQLITEFTQLITEETLINSGESTQRKVKESKGKEIESKVKESNNDNKIIIETPESFYTNNISPITQFVADDINNFINEGYEESFILLMMKSAVRNNARNWNYISASLLNNGNKGIKTVDQYEAYEAERRRKKGEQNGGNEKCNTGGNEQTVTDIGLTL